jgi:hypothetical protein
MRAKGALSQPLLLAAAALALTVSQAAAQCTNKPMNGNWPTDTKAPGWTCTGTVALGGTCSAACKDGKLSPFETLLKYEKRMQS